MINRSVIAGRLVKYPELKKTHQGHSVTNFTVAVQGNYNPERTHFINGLLEVSQQSLFVVTYSKLIGRFSGTRKIINL